VKEDVLRVFRHCPAGTCDFILRCRRKAGDSVRIPSEPRSEWNSPPRRSARHHVLLIFLSFLLSRVHTVLPRVRQQLFKLATQDDLRVPITFTPALTASFLSTFVSSTAPLSRSRTTFTRCQAATVRSPSYVFFNLPFVYLHLFHSFPITGTPEFAATVQNLDTAERQHACILV